MTADAATQLLPPGDDAAAGMALYEAGRLEAAAPLLRRALAAHPDDRHTRGCLANLLLTVGNAVIRDDPCQAERHYREAIYLQPGFFEAMSNLGEALVEQHRLAEALALFRAALTLRPTDPSTGFAYGVALLLSGDLPDGWHHFEARRAMAAWHYDRRGALPQWVEGMPVHGRHLLLMAEQGIGDVIQFARYAPLLAQRGAQVTLEVPAALHLLFDGMPGVHAVVEADAPAPGCDLACPLLSLPLLFGTGLDTIPAEPPALHVPEDRVLHWSKYLPEHGLRVGLVCSGDARNPNDAVRSIAFAELLPLLQCGDACFVLLQQEVRASDQAAVAAAPDLLAPGAALRDFADTAALISLLDVVIAADTGVAHLAAALGRPVWLLLPYRPDWRWMLQRRDSPWYPSMRLYRQPAHGDWASVVADAQRDLAAMLAPGPRQQIESPTVALASAQALLADGDKSTALAWLRAATQHWPDVPEVWFALGCALSDPQERAEAIACYRRTIALDSSSAEAHNNLGNMLLADRQPEAAVAAYRAAAALRSDMPELWFGLANALIEAKQLTEAEAACRQALTLRPDCVEALNSLGNALLAQHRAEDAMAAYRAALALRPDETELLVGLGNALLEAGDAVAAEQICRSIRARRPDFADAAQNLGNALAAQHRLDEALDAYADAVRLAPEETEHRNNYGLTLLLAGRFEEGWREHEFRRVNPRLQADYARRPEIPRWQVGMPLEGRRVLVMMEQGYGDQIQFLRYVPMLASRGARVTVEVPRGLQPVFPSLRKAVRVIAPEEAASGQEVVCPLLSLPLYFGITPDTIPAPIPYAVAPPERQAMWRDWLGPRQGRRIGVVCSGKPSYGLDRRRSIPLATLAPLLRTADCSFVLLQTELRETDAAVMTEAATLRWPGTALRDFGDTAALISELDLVISVDTSVAHLAGAMGHRVWVLLPFVPDWRWQMRRPDSPWYPTMGLYRQPRWADWAGLVEAVRQDLAAL